MFLEVNYFLSPFIYFHFLEIVSSFQMNLLIFNGKLFISDGDQQHFQNKELIDKTSKRGNNSICTSKKV